MVSRISCAETAENHVPLQDMAVDCPTQIAIIAGVLGSLCLLLAIGMVVLWVLIRRLRRTLAETRTGAQNAGKNTVSTGFEEAQSNRSHHLSTSNLSRSDDGLSSKYSLYAAQPPRVNGTRVLPLYSYPVRPSAYLRNNQTAKYDSTLSTPTIASTHVSANANPLSSSDNSTSGRTRSNSSAIFRY